MVNYNNALIYKLCCKDTNIKEVYIGSTTNFTRRKHNHKSSCINEKDKKYNNKKYEFIRNNGGWENWDMVLIQKVSCNDKLELHKIERNYIEKFSSFLNCNSPIINKEEKNKKEKKYYLLNKDKISKRKKEYREKNREELLKKHKEYYNKKKLEKFQAKL